MRRKEIEIFEQGVLFDDVVEPEAAPNLPPEVEDKLLTALADLLLGVARGSHGTRSEGGTNELKDHS